MFGLSTVIWLENALNAHGHVTFVVHKRNRVAISSRIAHLVAHPFEEQTVCGSHLVQLLQMSRINLRIQIALVMVSC